MIRKHTTQEIKDLDKDKGIVTAYANVYNVEDADGDISMPGSFSKTVEEQFKKIRVYKNHDKNDIIGVPRELDADDPKGLLTVTKFINTDKARDMLTSVKAIVENGQEADMSIGVIPVRRSNEDRKKVLEWKLKEYSFLTNWGANSLATVEAIKSKKGTDQIIKSLEKAYDLDYSDERLQGIERLLKALDADQDDHLQPHDVSSSAAKEHPTDGNELISQLYNEMII